jgi:4-amino-4-deoxy-L-arabinose transferase-like glycosyltransferase
MRLAAVKQSHRLAWLLGVTTLMGAFLFLWRLHAVGQWDETPALFAAAGRAMADTGDWLTPRVNGHPRFDKPVLIYWLIGFFSLLPPHLDPLGSLAANLPSALAMIAVMLMLAFTVFKFQPQANFTNSLMAALAFGLSPLVLLWGRVSVSDPLLTACIAIALLGFWQCYAKGAGPWLWGSWIFLGLAILTKGPVALLIAASCLVCFGLWQGDFSRLISQIAPGRGLSLSLVVATPWYLLELWREGKPFLDSFFGYHNLQRFNQVVNHHSGPWWFFIPVLIIASLPATPLLLLGLSEQFKNFRQPCEPANSLARFACCWLLGVMLIFSTSATKLVSYLLPALPAMALLIGLSGGNKLENKRAFWGSVLIAALMGVGFLFAPIWLPLINDPEMPGFATQLLDSGAVERSGFCFLAAALIGGGTKSLLGLQLPLLLWPMVGLVPSAEITDKIRQQPVRAVAAVVRKQIRPGEVLAMVGINKPSLHYYTNQVVIYEGRPASGLRNLGERLQVNRQEPAVESFLLVIDRTTASQPFWKVVDHQLLTRQGIYELWRVPRMTIQQQAKLLATQGVVSTWQQPNPERY